MMTPFHTLTETEAIDIFLGAASLCYQSAATSLEITSPLASRGRCLGVGVDI